MVVLANGHSSTNSAHANGVQKSDDPSRSWGFATRAVHVGSEPSTETGAVIPPISLSTTFKQDSVGIHKGFEYTRSQNPSRAALEKMLASIEAGGAHALAFSSGSAATATVIQSLGSDAHIIAVNDVYGGTWRYMERVANELSGLSVSWIDPEGSAEQIRAALRPNTKLIWLEAPTNPLLLLPSLPEISALLTEIYSHPPEEIAKLNFPRLRPAVLVDNTFLSPYYASPLLSIRLPDGTMTDGADIVIHSLTKYINGHSDVLLGCIILPPHSAHLERLAFLQNAHGAVPSPFDCFLAQRGAKTLQLRMQASGQSALALAQTLRAHPAVESVIYPGLATHPRHQVAWRSLSPHARRWIDKLPGVTEDGHGDFPFSGMLSVRLRSETQALRFLEELKLFTLAESLGGVESLAEHPATMTHSSIPVDEREERGITGGLVRMSVGVEDTKDLIRDALRALEIASALPN
ncbi:hypothetical protein MKEN_00346500 [Mycena kentingensis (nom. inval.)]|nr:hypothetical protein MKEN_00346500 [Mycena kentingensis (nom. inval.)]